MSCLAAALAACGGGDGTTLQEACSRRANDTPQQLSACIDVTNVEARLQALAAIARDHGGSRAVGTSGFKASVDYVAGVLEQAGYRVTLQPFTHSVFEVAGSTLAAGGAGIDHAVLDYSGSGDVTAPLARPAGGATGCEAADFAGFPAGAIALIERGGCTFGDKARHAADAGAVAVVMANNEAGPVDGTLGEDFALPLPVLGVTQAAGAQLAAALPAGVVLRAQVDAGMVAYESVNVLAESAGGDPGQAIVAGAHLDTVPGTAGSNDNGSGVAALLEAAVQLAQVDPRHKLRFAFWGSEEFDLNGSRHYVESLPAAELARIALYLNFDMIASPNYGYHVEVGAGPERPLSADLLRQAFTGFYAARGAQVQMAPGIAGRSDHESFADHGIPFAALSTGADEIKTAQEAATWGGTAGVAYDSCYHQPCDGLANISRTALAVNADVAANALLYFALDGLPR